MSRAGINFLMKDKCQATLSGLEPITCILCLAVMTAKSDVSFTVKYAVDGFKYCCRHCGENRNVPTLDLGIKTGSSTQQWLTYAQEMH